MISRIKNVSTFSIALFDLISLNLCFSISMSFLYAINKAFAFVLLSIAINLTWLIVSYATALYISKTPNYTEFFIKTIKSFFFFLAIIFYFIFLYHFEYSRVFSVYSIGTFSIFLLLTRFLLLLIEYYNEKSAIIRNIVIIGYNRVASRLVDFIIKNENDVRVHGFFDDEITYSPSAPILGKFKEVINYCLANGISEIYSTLSPENYPILYDLAEEADINYIRFKYVPDFKIFINRKMHIELLNDIPILSLRPDPLEDSSERFKKRLFDLVFSILICVLLLWWLIPIVALFIKMESKGPAFFKQLRTGKNNKPFYCYKFRSLHVNADSDKKQVRRGDSRFTRIGKIIRKTNVDELPQIFNVLEGHMSIVGPRPHMLKHTDEWAKYSNLYMTRHYLKPGITGWAQVNGYRGEISDPEYLVKRVEHDIWYMENWSMWLDIRIILLSYFKTIQGDENAV